MATASTSSCVLPNDFICPVCMDVLQTPVKTLNCEHIFCRRCLVMATRLRGTVCPLCRGTVSERDRFAPTRATDVEMEMKKISGACTYCSKKIKFYYMRSHYKHCKRYQEEFGTLTKDDIKPHTSQQLTYTCPLCQSDNLSRKSLLEHCNNVHSHGVFEAFCPICISLPQGDPNHEFADIAGHLNARHQFNHEDFMDVFLDEDEQLRAAIENSNLHLR
ncbi:E3 ubiquitin-protein ligase RNF138 [Pelobates fuscus]|uniref:E3 ubiquitin-protein ligase RNF138 n=1 Tax=Pelobates fuscus TaxID=191477 RepID=UPI002FE4E415